MGAVRQPLSVIHPTRRERAETLRPDFDWQSYDKANQSQVERSKALLGANRHERRLGSPETKIIDMRSEDQRMSDMAIVKQGDALMKTAWNDLEEVKAAVYAAYKGGAAALDNAEMKAVALIAFNMQLDPSPGVGHLYAWKDKDKDGNLRFSVAVGYQGYVHKATQQYKFVHHCRAMTTSERQDHGLKENEIGAICELYEAGRNQIWRDMGLEPKPIIGSAVWRPEYNSDIKARNDKVPQGKSPLWVAQKNALKDAIRQLGISFGSMVIPEIDGMQYDRESDGWSMPVVEKPLVVQELTEEQIEELKAAEMAKNEPIEAHFTTETPAAAVIETPAPEPTSEQPGGDFPFEVAETPATTSAPAEIKTQVTLPIPDAKLTTTTPAADVIPVVQRPRTAAQVYEWLREIAGKQTSATATTKLNEKQRSDLVARIQEYAISNETAKHILKQAFGKDGTPALEYREKQALTSWLPAKHVLTANPDALEWISTEIKAIEAEMSATETEQDKPAALDPAA